MARLEKSPTQFTLDAKQVAELKRAGASEKLLAAMSGKRKPSGEQTGDVTDFAILLDCSGSMMEKTTDGKTKMAVAKAVVAELAAKRFDGSADVRALWTQQEGWQRRGNRPAPF
jgi:hypothetical protein